MIYALALVAICSPALGAQKAPRERIIVVRNDTSVTNPSYRRDSARRDSAARMLAAQGRVLTHTYFQIPEYHDEQQFQISAEDFGPMAYISASPFIGTFTSISNIMEQGKYGAFAAIVKVDTFPGGNLPAPYTNLNLRVGENCVWLANPTGDTISGWRGYVTPMRIDEGCIRPREGNIEPPALRVYRTTTRGFRFEHYPAVARFGDAKPRERESFGQPLLGVKCLAGWCEIGPPFVVEPMPPETLGNGKEGKIKGYHDVQTLAYKDANGVLRSAGRATLEPVSGLGDLSKEKFAIVSATDSSAGWVLVARIIFRSAPPRNTKYWAWGLRQGSNSIYLRRTAEDKWEMSTKGAEDIRYIWTNVTRDPHTDVHVPGTARWRFADFDPMGVWVRCGEACCSGDGGTGLGGPS